VRQNAEDNSPACSRVKWWENGEKREKWGKGGVMLWLCAIPKNKWKAATGKQGRQASEAKQQEPVAMTMVRSMGEFGGRILYS